MKKILMATDFSDNARHAAEYAYKLAGVLKADLVLCNAFIVPAEVPESGLITWPAYGYDEVVKESADDLKRLKEALEQSGNRTDFNPTITCAYEIGSVTGVVEEYIEKEDVELIVMGAHDHSNLSSFILGNHSRKMIDETVGPLLIVPSSTPFNPIKKIAFATDFKNIDEDLEAIYKLIDLARPLNADLLITHITFDKWPEPETRKSLEELLIQISNKANYPKVYYRVIKSESPEKGLGWLCDHGNVDMLAMVHRKHNLIEKIIPGSYTQKMAALINIPLLVVPGKV